MTDLPDHHLVRIEAAHDRIGVVEGRVFSLEKAEVVTEERFKNIQKSLDKIDGSVSKVGWTIISAVILALVAFMLKGGLNVGP